MDGQGMKRTRVVARASSLKSLKDSARHEPAHPTLESAHSYISHLLLTDFGLRLSIPVLRYTKQEHNVDPSAMNSSKKAEANKSSTSLAFGSMGNNMVRWAATLVRWATPWLVDAQANNHLNRFNNEGGTKFIQSNEGRQVFNQGNERVNNHGDNGDNQLNNHGDNDFNNKGSNEFKQVRNNDFNNKGSNEFKQERRGKQVFNQGNKQVDNHGNKDVFLG